MNEQKNYAALAAQAKAGREDIARAIEGIRCNLDSGTGLASRQRKPAKAPSHPAIPAAVLILLMLGLSVLGIVMLGNWIDHLLVGLR